MAKVLAVITGQLRNAVENIDNWNSFFSKNNLDVEYLFVIWDEIGNVDPNKIHLRSLDVVQAKENFILSSRDHIYFAKKRELLSEIEHIKKKLKCVEVKVYKYKKEYLESIDGLEICEKLKKDSHPWWQGSIPVAYLNKEAMNIIKDKYLGQYEYYCRLQSEVNFDVDGSVLDFDSDIITSPDTINKDKQVSIKFFMGKYDSFSTLMNAFYELIDPYKNYNNVNSKSDLPIGERFLKQLANKYKLNVAYSVRTIINREKLLPRLPVYKTNQYFLDIFPEIVFVNKGVYDSIKMANDAFNKARSDKYLLIHGGNFIPSKVLDKAEIKEIRSDIERNIRKSDFNEVIKSITFIESKSSIGFYLKNLKRLSCNILEDNDVYS